jgi:hypothetical protein
VLPGVGGVVIVDESSAPEAVERLEEELARAWELRCGAEDEDTHREEDEPPDPPEPRDREP